MASLLNGFIAVSILCTIGFIYGVLMFLSDFEPNHCEMTYMFEYPQFVRIAIPEDLYFKRYALYAYSEGRFTQKARDMRFDGVPVLFIPGNAGSYKQVRSLASVALRKSVNSRTVFHFDYFTIDTNGEVSAANGVLLDDQLAYTNFSLRRILELYSRNQGSKPKSVIIVGHSMGGIIAKGLAASLPLDNDLVPLIITLSTPHKRLPVVFDYYAYNFYKKVARSEDAISGLVVNIYGGYNDFMVSPNLAASDGISAVATHVPKVWLPMDHLCILWCKQLVLVINRALFESIDPATKQISTDQNYLRNIFETHLLTNSGIKAKLRDRYEIAVTMESNGEWIEYLPRQYSIKLIEGTKNTKYYMIRLSGSPKHEMLSIVAMNLGVTDWVYVCPASEIQGHSRICLQGMHLSHLSEIAPSKKHKRRTFNMNLHALQKKYPTFSHVVVRVPMTSEPITLHVDVYENNQRKIEVKLPSRFSFKKHVILEETAEKAVHYQLDFPKLTHIMQVFLLYVEPIKCNFKTYHSTATVISPWHDDRYHHHFTGIDNDPLVLRLYASKPFDDDNAEGAIVQLTLDPECRYKISIKPSISKQLAQFARYYSPFMFSSVASVTLLVLVFQLRGVYRTQRFPMFLTSLKSGTKPYYFLPIVKIATQCLSVPVLLHFLPVPDWTYIHREGLDAFFVPILLFLTAVGCVWILVVTLMVTLFMFESTVHKIAVKVISKAIRTPASWSDWMLSGFQKFPMLVAACLMAISTTTCGGLALALGCVFYFFKLTQMSQDMIENIVKKVLKRIGRWFRRILNKKEVKAIENHKKNPEQEAITNSTGTQTEVDENVQVEEEDRTGLLSTLLQEILENNELFFHFTMFCLWFLVTCINVPTALTWAHNFKYNPKLVIDPSFMPGIILCACAVPLWQMELPKVSSKGYLELGFVIYALAILGQIYGTFSLFVLNYTLTAAITLVVLHQLIAPREFTGVYVEPDEDADPSFKKSEFKMG